MNDISQMVDLVKRWKEAARRDDLFDHMVPSDVRQLVKEIERLRQALADAHGLLVSYEKAADRFEDLKHVTELHFNAFRAASAEGFDLAKTDKSTLIMWRAGADFFSSKYSYAERCEMARNCYEAMIQVRESRPTEKGVVDANQPKPWHYPSADESKRE